MKLKSSPKDFIVEEKIKLNLAEQGDYYYYLLKKANFNTQDAISVIAKKFNIALKSIGFSGNKDKHAFTLQYISIYNPKGKQFPKELQDKNGCISIEYIGRGKEPIYLGRHYANKFTIAIRAVSAKQIKTIRQKISSPFHFWFINYFDEQRFSKNNALIGKAIVTRDFKKACNLLHIQLANNNFLNQLKTIPIKRLRFYVHAYQSYLWNKALSEKLEKAAHGFIKISSTKLAVPKRKPKIKTFPIIGYLSDNKAMVQYKQILKKENISQSSFLIKQFPEISSEGEERKAGITIRNLKLLPILKDNKHYVATISFKLPKGCYATMAVKQLFA